MRINNYSTRWRGGLLALLGILMIAPASRPDDSDPLLERFQEMVSYNLDNPQVVESARLDAVLRHFQGRSLGERIASWATWFQDLGTVEYRFGLAPAGYVTEGRLCQDFATDCVLFMYRVTELARSTTAEEAVQFAFGTRFYGASLGEAVLAGGQVNYDVEAHLEYSEELIASEIWGKNVTASVGEPVLAAWVDFDRIETARECGLESDGPLESVMDTPASFDPTDRSGQDGVSRPKLPELRYVPRDAIDYAAFESGDIVWFVGNPVSASPDKDDGRVTLIHHLGFIDRRSGSVDLVHAAMKPLPGVYEKSGLVRVRLADYLDRVDRFRGIVVTRLVDF